MLLLVPVHGAGMVWVNGHPGAWAVVIYWVVHVFRMPLFFAMSGFFLTMLLTRKGLRETARNRTIRIVVPLGLGLVTLVPLFFFLSQQTGTPIGSAGIPDGSPFSFEPNFLWFLWYLLIVDGIAIAAYLLAPRALKAAGRWLRRLISRPAIGIPLLAIPTALSIWWEPTWTAAAPMDTFVPQLTVLAYYAIFFALGATLSAQRELVESASRNAWKWALCAVAAAIPAGVLFTLHNSPGYASHPLVHGPALFVYAIATWASLMALVGLADRFLNRPRPAMRYVADSSYWIYLSHLPAMVLVMAWLGTTALGTAPLFTLVTLGSLAFSLVTYPLFVRYTAIGRMLNGPRERPRWRESSKSSIRSAAAAVRRA